MLYPKYLTWDVECTGATNGTFGNPFTDSNRLCVVGYGDSSGCSVLNLLDPRIPTGPSLQSFGRNFANPSLISVAFNWKFDAHWLRRYGVRINAAAWDCQLAHFIIHDQQNPLPSLEDVASYYGVGEKYVDIEHTYWGKGIDNDAVPIEVLETRVQSDVRLTSSIFELQIDQLQKDPRKKNLIWLACQDQKILAEMEWNGLKYDIKQSLEEGDKIRGRQKEISRELSDVSGVQDINWNSKDHLSCVLFGGELKVDFKEDYIFIYKDGSTKPKTRWQQRVTNCPRRLEPLRGTEYSKGGVFSTDADTLLKLKPKDRTTRRIIELIQEYRKLDKQVGTYYHGIPKLYTEMGWTNQVIHGQLNSSVAKTGRLSSSRPNQQNMDHEIRKCIVSRF